MDEGFVDLRYGGERDPGGESFWPSFTDIMMVVLMIFMIASTILMLRNWDLVRELRATLLAEREAEELALSMTRTSETLEERLAQAQHEISQLRIQLLREGEQRNELSSELAQTRQQQQKLESDRKRLSTQLQKADIEREQLTNQLQSSREESARLSEQQTSLQVTIDELRELEITQAEQLAQLRDLQTISDEELAALRGEYDELSVKYNKLIKPARTAAGKYLVSVRYRKEGGRYMIEFKESDNDDYEFLSRDELESRLSELKDQYSGSLYVKVIIPKDSGLSYNEAWSFTQNILTRYDYYYQD